MIKRMPANPAWYFEPFTLLEDLLMKMRKLVTGLALAGAGLLAAPTQAAPINDGGLQKGSAVLYPLFQLAADGYTTVIRLTNNHPTKDVTVHLVRVCGGIKSFGGQGTCDASNRQVKLTHNQTKVWNVENFFTINPIDCETRTGYVVAYAVDANAASVPIEWNHLSGSTYQRRLPNVQFPNATAGAQAVVFEGDPGNAVAEGAALPGAVGGAFPLLPFDGVAYQQLGTTLHTDFISTTNAANPANGRRSALAVLTLDIDAGFQNDPTVIAVDWYNEAEDIFSTSHEYVCHDYQELQDISAAFTLGNLGSFYGTLYVTPFGTDAIQGQIKELEPNRETLRNLFHDAVLRSTTFQGR